MFFWPNVGQDAFLMMAHVEKLSEIVFGYSLISRTMSRTCFGQDLAKKRQNSNQGVYFTDMVRNPSSSTENKWSKSKVDQLPPYRSMRGLVGARY